MATNNNIEQNIIEAASNLFIKKGYSNTTIQNIATEAKVNKALLYYYYHSKENLFNIVLENVSKQIYKNVAHILSDRDKDIFTKVNDMVDEFISFFNHNTKLSVFVTSEYARNPNGIEKQMKDIISASESFQFFSEQIRKEYEKGIIRQTIALSLVSNILALCAFPAIVHPVICNINKKSADKKYTIPELYKKEITDLITDIIKIK